MQFEKYKGYLSPLFLGIALLLFLFALGEVMVSVYHRPHSSNQPRQAPAQAPHQTPSSPQIKTTVEPESAFNGPVVHYKDNTFLPQSITVRASTSGGSCLLKIINDAETPLLIRLNPASKDSVPNYGIKYSAVSPNGSVIIDPRFNRPSEAFHNQEKPSQEFSVIIDTSCYQ